MYSIFAKLTIQAKIVLQKYLFGSEHINVDSEYDAEYIKSNYKPMTKRLLAVRNSTGREQ